MILNNWKKAEVHINNQLLLYVVILHNIPHSSWGWYNMCYID